MRNIHTTELEEVKLLKADQVAELLALHVRSVWRLSSSGEIPKPVRIGKSTRWRLTDLRAFLNGEIGGERR